MYFVINSFITAICIIALVIFAEVFPKVVKIIISLIAVFTSSYALAILVKKIGEWTSIYPAPKDVFPNFYYILPIVFAITLLSAYFINKRKSKS